MKTVRIENIKQDKYGSITGNPCAFIPNKAVLLLEVDCFEYKPCEDMEYIGAHYNKNGISHVDCVFVEGKVIPMNMFWTKAKLKSNHAYAVIYKRDFTCVTF